MSSVGRVYRSSVQALAGFLIAGTAMAILLMTVAKWGNRVVPVEMHEPTLRMLAYQAPMAVSALLLTLVIYLAYAGSGKEVRITGEGLSFSHHGRATVIPWDLMVVVKPAVNSSNMFSSALVSDGRRFVRLERVLFPEFESMMNAVEEKRKSRQGSRKIKF